MGSYKRPRVFLPLDLEILSYVYQAAWARIEARDFYRDRSKDGELRGALCKQLFASADPPVDFDTLYDKLVASLPKTGTTRGRSLSLGPNMAADHLHRNHRAV